MTQFTLSLAERVHFRALAVAARYIQTEAELIDTLQQVEDHRVFIKRGHSSLFSYAVRELGLGENIAYTLITVSRKAREIPELKVKLKTGAITLSNARRVASVLTPQNKDEWIKKASELSNRALEKEIVKIKPTLATREHASYVTPDRVRLELGLSEHEMLKLRRVQDLLSQAKRRAVSLEETIGVMTEDFLTRHDPVAKAKRHQVRQGPNKEVSASVAADGGINQLVTRKNVEQTYQQLVTLQAGELTDHPLVTLQVGKHIDHQLVTRPEKTQQRGFREPIPAAILHQVNLRDERRCAHILKDGRRCEQRRWIDIHHKIPVAQGGQNITDNLITLCKGHHKYLHEFSDLRI